MTYFYCPGFVLDETINKLQDFCWVKPEREQARVLCKFIDKYMEINSGHFSRKVAPMVFKDAYTLAQTILREEGLKAEPLTNDELAQLASTPRTPKFVPNSNQHPKNNNEGRRTRALPQTKDGADICLHFNSMAGCMETTKSGVATGASCQRFGKRFLHICSWRDFATNEVCAKQHSKIGNHKK